MTFEEVSKSLNAATVQLSPAELPALLEQAAQLPHVHVCGLMTIPPPTESTRFLEAMQELFLKTKELQIPDTEMNILSMGMSDDYAQAIQFGSNLVRIGSALFGARNYQK